MPLEESSAKNIDKIQPDSSKVYKIKFSINLLTSVGEYFAIDPQDKDKTICMNENIDFMSVIAKSDEIEIFDS